MSTTTALGAIIASGIGFLSTSGSSTSSTVSNLTFDSNTTSATSSISPSNTTTFLATGPIDPLSSSVNSNGSSTVLSKPSIAPSGNSSLDTCWNEWQSYWIDSLGVSTQVASGCISTPYTSLLSLTETASPATTTVTTQTLTSIYTNGPFTMSSATITTALTWTLSSQAATTVVYTDVGANSSCSVTPDAATITKPPCSLPSMVPQCQFAWEQIISSGVDTTKIVTSPPCSQASMDASQCSWFRASYVQAYGEYIPLPGYVWPTPVPMSRGYVIAGNVTDVSHPWVWPTSTTLAPSCTLGCARCAITGGTIQVLYWPSTTAMATATPIVATTLNTTLTYPTLYIYFSEVYASDSCTGIGPTVRETIIPITDTAELSSRYMSLTERGYGGNTGLAAVTTIVEPFNASELVPPVPYSIYSKQDWCQTAIWTQENSAAFFHSDTTIMPSCSTTEPYKPILFLPSKLLQQMNPAWADCSGDVRGVYDPPTALSIATSIKGPSTLSGEPITTTSAQPVASVRVTTATPTAAPVTTSAPTRIPQNSGNGPSPEPSHVASTVDPGSTLHTSSNNLQASLVDQSSGSTDPIPSPTVLQESPNSRPPDSAAGPAHSQDFLPASAASEPNIAGAIASIAAQLAGSSTYSTSDQLQAQSSATARRVSSSAFTFEAVGITLSLRAGQATTINSHIFSAESSGGAIIVDGQSTLIPTGGPQSPAHSAPSDPPIGRLNSGDVFVSTDGTILTIAPGHATTIRDHVISAASGGDAVVVDGTRTIATAGGAAASAQTAPAALIISQFNNGNVVVNTDGSSFVLASGEATTFQGHTISVPSTGGTIILDGVTTSVPYLQTRTSDDGAQDSKTGVVISTDGLDATLRPGQALTSGGHKFSAASTGNVVMVDGKTVTGAATDTSTLLLFTASAATRSAVASSQVVATSGAKRLMILDVIGVLVALVTFGST